MTYPLSIFFFGILGYLECNGSLWRAFPEQLNHSQASANCTSQGGRLATVRTDDDRRCFEEAVKQIHAKFNNVADREYVWVGLDDKKEEGVYVWSYDRRVELENSTNWLDDQPGRSNDRGGALQSQDCGYARGKLSDMTTGRLGDDECSRKRSYICQQDKKGTHCPACSAYLIPFTKVRTKYLLE